MKWTWALLTLIIACTTHQDKNNHENKPSSNSIKELKQSNKDLSEKTESDCHLPKEHPLHSDPYYNGHLHENFDPQQVDFSSKFFELRKKTTAHSFDSIVHYDCSAIWVSEFPADGIIGLDYRRLVMVITSVEKKSGYIYSVKGKSKVKDNECDFEGSLTIKHVNRYKEPHAPDKRQGIILGTYELSEDPQQKYSGVFKGTFESYFLIHHSDSIVKNKLYSDADGYHNNTFVGVWKGYSSTTPKKCIWGDYRLPFTFDYDVGDGEMIINKKYRTEG